MGVAKVSYHNRWERDIGNNFSAWGRGGRDSFSSNRSGGWFLRPNVAEPKLFFLGYSSGSRSQKVLALEPEPAPTSAFNLKCSFQEFLERIPYWFRSLSWSCSRWIMIKYSTLVWPDRRNFKYQLQPWPKVSFRLRLRKTGCTGFAG
jgi:hypothetical protein